MWNRFWINERLADSQSTTYAEMIADLKARIDQRVLEVGG